MKKARIGLAVLGTLLSLALPSAVARPQSPRQEPPENPGKSIQTFQGTVDAVDSKAKTMTVGGQLIYIADATKITKQGKTVMLSEVAAGDMVHGTSHVTFDGKTEALTVLVTAKQKDAALQ